MELQGFSPTTCKIVKDTLLTPVMEHTILCDHEVVHEDFKFFDNESNKYLLELKEVYLVEGISHNLRQSILPGVITVWVFHTG